jgi:2-dehydropantoate 2-reductase
MNLDFRTSVLVVGAGSIGAMFGASLVKAGYSVTFAGKPGSPYTYYIRNHGLKVCYPSGEIFAISPRHKNVSFTDTANRLNYKFGLIVVAVKSNNLLNVLPYILHHSDRNSILIHAQNGIPYWWFNDNMYTSQLSKHIYDEIRNKQYLKSIDPCGRILTSLGDRHLVGCVIKAPSDKSKLGSIDIKKTPKIVLGLTRFQEYQEADLISLSEFCTQLTKNGLYTQNSDNIREEICKKLSINVTTNTLSALMSVSTARLTNNQVSRTLIINMLEEVNKVFKAFNVREQNLPTQQELFMYIEEPGSQKHLPSLTQDFFKRQEGELNLIEAPVEMAKIARIKVPVLESVSELLKAGQDFVLRREYLDTNLLGFNSNNTKIVLNSNIYKSSTIEAFRVSNLHAHIARLNREPKYNSILEQKANMLGNSISLYSC